MDLPVQVDLPDWVVEAVRLGATRKGGPRVPVGEVVSFCRWPLSLTVQRAQAGDTLGSIAAAAYPVPCMACRSEHRIDVLAIEARQHGDEDPRVKLDKVACSVCGTVGLWPPITTRPAQELEWANKKLWSSYGADAPLPKGEVVLVPQLCGCEVKQLQTHGPQPTYDGDPHKAKNSDRWRDKLVSNAWEELSNARAGVVAESTEDSGYDALGTSENAGDDVSDIGAPENADISEIADDAVEVVEPVAAPAESPVEKTVAAATPSPTRFPPPAARRVRLDRETAVAAASVELAAELAVPESAPVPVGGDDPLAPMRAALAAMAAAVGQASRQATVALEGFEETDAAVAKRLADLESRCTAAESEVAQLRASLAEAERRIKQAEQDRFEAQGAEKALAKQLERYTAVQHAPGAGRRPARVRLTPAQLSMLGDLHPEARGRLSVTVVVIDAEAEEFDWYIGGKRVGDGVVKTLESLLRHKFIAFGRANREGFAPVKISPTTQPSGYRRTGVPFEAPGGAIEYRPGTARISAP
ncbi:hypothetical protein, partial [Nocardia sp. CA-084685]|uniref:hypothetical protein n=1 Tax=Nocardia sp. CA-084685 TaxID=3239970 RepID=UPI003D995CFA